MPLTISRNGVKFIIGFEGKHKKLPGGKYQAYQCPAHVWTIHAGVTEGVHEGMIVTEAEGETMFRLALAKFEKAVNDLVKVELNQNQFDALVSFAYNCGSGARWPSPACSRRSTRATSPEPSVSSANGREAGARCFLAWCVGARKRRNCSPSRLRISG